MAFLNTEGLAHLWDRITMCLNKKVDIVPGKGLSTEDYTAEEKNKLLTIEPEANKTVIDDALQNNSTNPVQNKVIASAIQEINNNMATKTYEGENALVKTSLDCVVIEDSYALTVEQLRVIEQECIVNNKILVISMGDMQYVCSHVHYPWEGSIAFVFVNYAADGSITINRHAYDLNTGNHDYNTYNFYSNRFKTFEVTYDDGTIESFNVMTF